MLHVVRFLVAGFSVTLASLVATRFSGVIGGMLLAFPFLITTGLLFSLTSSNTSNASSTFSQMASGVLYGMIPLSVYAVVLVLSSTRLAPLLAISLGILAWATTALVVQVLR